MYIYTLYILYILYTIYTIYYIYTIYIPHILFYSNSTRHFFKTVIFRVLRIFNGLLQTKSVIKNIQTE